MSSQAIDSTESAAGNFPPSTLSSLKSDLGADSLKKKLQAVRDLADLGIGGEPTLIEFVRQQVSASRSDQPTSQLTAAHGSAYQQLYRSESPAAQSFVTAELPSGILIPTSAQNIDYSDLQMLLVRQDYQAADKLTMEKLCELAGESAIKRKWVYFSEVSQLPALDLQTVDTLWRIYSEDKFGWSKQRELWLRLGQDWERLWTQLIWKSEAGVWTRYPNEFIWDLSAPDGHLPLCNQLRGVRMMDSLLSHPAWAP
jgi:hypothetical protein